MEQKRVIVDNPTNLPIAPLDQFEWFQGDFKKPIEPEALRRIKHSIVDHHIFLGKAAFLEDGVLHTEDGHQTLSALRSLREDDGYVGCVVVLYREDGGRMVESERVEYDEIMVPYQLVVPQGDDVKARKKDAAEKLLQINSRYAEIDPSSGFLKEHWDSDELTDLLERILVPELSMEMFEEPEQDPQAAFHEEFNSITDETADYPLVPKYSEKYDAVIIISSDEIMTLFLETALQLRYEQSYKNNVVGKSFVLTAERFAELWKKRRVDDDGLPEGEGVEEVDTDE